MAYETIGIVDAAFGTIAGFFVQHALVRPRFHAVKADPECQRAVLFSARRCSLFRFSLTHVVIAVPPAELCWRLAGVAGENPAEIVAVGKARFFGDFLQAQCGLR